MKQIFLIISSIVLLLSSCAQNNVQETNQALKRYVNNDAEQCKAIRFICEAGEEAFFDDQGCGCVKTNETKEEPSDQTSDNIPTTEEQTLCTQEYKPVCGMLDVQCIKAPCNPVPVTYSNKCLAEQAGAKDIKEGTCEELGIKPTE